MDKLLIDTNIVIDLLSFRGWGIIYLHLPWDILNASFLKGNN
ncbi:MAG TPA: hypothetical protein VFI29_04945 [Hanamia sp.]|nr:hypothetical protein [Hanamia sp.]